MDLPKKQHRVIIFNQKTWSKSYVDMNTQLRKSNFEKNFSS